MPLHKTIRVNNKITVYIWNIEENLHELNKNLTITKNCEDRIANMKSEIHQRGFLSVRQLLKVAGYEPYELFYDKKGKPHLSDGKHISITHSFIFSAIIISETDEVGIDIELIRDKIQRIGHKFVNYEYNYLNEKALTQKLSIIWCIKESLYKAFATKGVSFKDHIKVLPFDVSEDEAIAWVLYEGKYAKYKANYFSINGYMCSYAIKVIP
ncbi:4'-phosphopantetheinyl transferase family protein [Ascidiimonas sp. W6]|uniref:4'-phosphopantetheinyl transferase family protein n=1 Tax=Ascidiimonas meishanensis TaxID=3128903 RepID=UPI0030EBD487